MYPEHNWQSWRFTEQVPQFFWENQESHRQFFDWLGTQLGCKEMDDWYNVSVEDIYKHGGSGLLNDYYNNSPSKALQTVYPEHQWLIWRFGQTPKGFWKKPENHRQFFD